MGAIARKFLQYILFSLIDNVYINWHRHRTIPRKGDCAQGKVQPNQFLVPADKICNINTNIVNNKY